MIIKLLKNYLSMIISFSVFLLLIGIIVVMVVLWRLGRLSVVKEDIRRRATVVRKNISNKFSSAHSVSMVISYNPLDISIFH
jgi:hypothetical protein